MCEILIEDIGGEVCEPVAGLTKEVLISPHSELTTIVDPPADIDGAALDTLAKITGPHIAPVGKGFTTITGITSTGTINSSLIGESGRRVFQNQAVVVVAGSNDKILGFLRAAKNMRFIMMVEEVGSGALRQLGSKRQPAEFINIEAAIEAAMEGANTVTLTAQDKQLWPAPIYTGTVPMRPVPETP